MKQILLVSPRRGTDSPSGEDRQSAEKLGFPRGLMLPLDLATLKALTPPGIQVDIWDESVRPSIDENTDLGHDHDLIGVTGYMTYLHGTLELAEVAREPSNRSGTRRYHGRLAVRSRSG
jgi:hypothetical protein